MTEPRISYDISPSVTVVKTGKTVELWFYDNLDCEATAMLTLKPETAYKLGKYLINENTDV